MRAASLLRFILFLSSFSLSASALASLDAGIAAFEGEDYPAALALFEPLAAAGNPKAMVWLARVHDEGMDDPAAALPWYQKAAQRGVAEAQARLGDFYAQGLGVEPDDEKALLWYGKAVAQGSEDGMFGLGVLQQESLGDNVAARRWFEKAADKGHADAQYRLGVLLLGVPGVARDVARAWMFLELAADAEHEEALTARDVLEINLKPAELARGRELLAQWQKAHP
ncbi:MAG: tetratricopeptide repeat protein [Moraxellaceae bacterium]|nr:tetratricopeptide repeat protein [Moraxellaceae bacterium]